MSIYNGAGALVQNSTARLGIHERTFGRAGEQGREDLERLHGEASSLYAAWMLHPMDSSGSNPAPAWDANHDLNT